ncbi:hypothetical protein [Marinobacter salicampi]|uniref:hypothetical protein n=1 Tax=Marinobacter salicampi TaxID=435907 RepID=UPI0014082039|nr:hypothetical protein [Marinobacter salicampi]
MAKHKVWRSQEDEVLARLYPDPGFKIVEIAKLLKVSRHQVTNRAAKLGITREPVEAWPAEDLEFIRRHAAEKGYQYCADALGKSKLAVRNKCLKLGLPKPAPSIKRWPDQDNELLLSWRAQNIPYRTIAKKLGRTTQATRAQHQVLRKRLTGRKYPRLTHAPKV